MSRVFITGDVHYPIDVYKLNSLNFPANDLTKDDYVIILGDAGFVWDGDIHDRKGIEWANSRPYTTIYIDGNHENHEALRLYPVVDFHGAKAHQISKSLYHIMRGEILTLNSQTYFCFGGAFSHDYQYRTEGISWWQDELPTQQEVDRAFETLEKVNYKVDFVLTHDVDTNTYKQLGYDQNSMDHYDTKYLNIHKFLDEIRERTSYNCWFAGHYHVTQYVNDIQIMYHEILEVLEDTISWYSGRVHEIKRSEYQIEDIYEDQMLDDLYISLRYNQIGTMEDFKRYKDTIYPLKEFLSVLETTQEKEAVICLYKEYLIRLEK